MRLEAQIDHNLECFYLELDDIKQVYTSKMTEAKEEARVLPSECCLEQSQRLSWACSICQMCACVCRSLFKTRSKAG